MIKNNVRLLMPIKFKLGVKHEFSAAKIINCYNKLTWEHLPLTSSRVFWSKASLSKTVWWTSHGRGCRETTCALFRRFSHIIYQVPSNHTV